MHKLYAMVDSGHLLPLTVTRANTLAKFCCSRSIFLTFTTLYI